ncbi:MAG: PilZ domain-containing protein [Syntrophobacteria bacterium]
MAVARERRKHDRILVKWPVVVVTPQRYIGGEAKNISVGGASVVCTRDPGRYEPLRLAIKIPASEELLQVTGIVVWSKLQAQPNDLYGCETGIRFTSFIGNSRQYLTEAIAKCLRLK